MSYHNTVPVSGTELSEAVKAAEQQDAAVMALFNAGGCWSPSEAHEYFTRCGKRWPLTSVRRAISNLTKAGSLTKTDMTKVGPYGRSENIWSKA